MNNRQPAPSVLAAEALQNLRDGNQRFVDADRCIDTYLSHTQLDEHIEGQSPYAIILGCSDSRVPVEIIFDVGLGDAFVIRVAGNVVAPSLIGSVELAAAKFGARLVVVLGHTGCGAISTTIDSMQSGDSEESENIGSIIDWIRPSVEKVMSENPGIDGQKLVNEAVRSNVRSSAESLRHGSDLLEKLIRDDGLVVVGAEYSLSSGLVEFFDGV
ncbi:MAG: carbonic anhydrase [Woeseia sp.]|jgi:carbonic anhydrase|nr:carbonic anhydrase [Woeseia sp.]